MGGLYKIGCHGYLRGLEDAKIPKTSNFTKWVCGIVMVFAVALKATFACCFVRGANPGSLFSRRFVCAISAQGHPEETLYVLILVGAELVFWGRAFWNVTTQSSVTESPPGQYLGGDCPIGLLKVDFHFFQIARKLHHRLVINISHDRNHNSGQVVKTMRGMGHRLIAK